MGAGSAAVVAEACAPVVDEDCASAGESESGRSIAKRRRRGAASLNLMLYDLLP